MTFAMGPILILGVLVSWLVATVTLIVLGFKGKALWSSPYCIACKYDLRGRVPEESPNCPECGADLTHPKAVGFLRQGRRPKLIVFGVIVFILPVLVIAAAFFILPYFAPVSPGNLQSQTNSSVLTYVQNQPDQPWGWDELANRIRSGSLSVAESEQALFGLIRYMKSQKPGGWNSPMPWQDDFLKQGYLSGHFSDTAVIDFADAYYTTTPKLGPLKRIKYNYRNCHIRIEYGSSWSLAHQAGMPVDMLWAVEKIEIDGESVAFKEQSVGHSNRQVFIDLPPLDPGDHELKATLVAAYVEVSPTNTLPMQQPDPANWPTPIKKWSLTLSDTLHVLEANEQPVTLSTDPSLDPGPDGVTAKHVVVRRDHKRLTISTELTVNQSYQGVLSCDFVIKLDGQSYDMGSLCYFRSPSINVLSGSAVEIPIDALSADVRTADIILTPNPSHLYPHQEVDKAWGKPIEINDIPIFRYDLQEPDDNNDPQ